MSKKQLIIPAKSAKGGSGGINHQPLAAIRHSCAHLLAAAVIDLYPNVKLGIGPAIDNGFYYDFLFKKPISEKELPKIEKKMEELKKKKLKFVKKGISFNEAKKIFKNQLFKLELIEELASETVRKKLSNCQTVKLSNCQTVKLSLYQTGDFVDLCKGPHVSDTSKIGQFKLLSIAGAYWKGDEKNPMLTRIYGACFETKKELDEYLKLQKEAKKRDHRRLGKELDLFHFSPIAPGMPFWHPKGVIVWNELLKFWQKIQKKYHYQEVKAPELLSVDIFKQSGHWDHYQDFMFFCQWGKDELYVLKPMDCPGEIEIYKEKMRSYRELPLRYAEVGLVHRKEKKGELNGLFRVAHITQDDAHIFITEGQIQEEVIKVIKLTEEIYKPFGLSYDIFLSTRPDKFMGDARSWDKAEKALKKALEANKISFKIKEGEGAFYGPKIDYDLQDALGRTWQCGTIQLDFFMPEKFDLKYIDKDGKEKRPVMIHRTIMGALERFIGILIEHYAGAFPVWFSPVQAVIIPITDKQIKYAEKIKQKLVEEELRVELDARSETTSYKIRDAQMQKVPYMLIVGEREVKDKKVAVRLRNGKDMGPMTLKKFLDRIKKEVAEKR